MGSPLPLKPNVRRAAILMLVALLFVLMAWRIHAVDYFEINPDEGLNAIKASLLLRGHALYGETWSDQPPLYTLMLAAVFGLFGEDITVARILNLAASFSILLGVWDILRRNGGPVHAAFGVVTVILLPFYVNLSVSAMVGLPAIALAVLALAALMRWHEAGDGRWLALSGALLGLSVMTKLFTAALVPVFAAGVLLESWRLREGRSRLAPAAIWLLAFGVTALGIFLFFVGWDNVQLLYMDHIKARETMRTEGTTLVGVMRKSLEFSLALTALAVIGLGLAWRQGRRVMLYPFVWGALALGLLWGHAPFWYHQTPLFTVPAAIVAGFACGEAAGLIRTRFRERDTLHKALALAVAGLLLVMAVTQGPRTNKSIRRWFLRPVETYEKSHLDSRQIVALMMKYKDRTRWIFTNRMMFAFRTGIGVPPELVLSSKRINTKALDEATAMELIRKYEPEQMVLVRMGWPRLGEYLRERYELLYTGDGKELYVSKKLTGPDSPATGEPRH